MSNDDRIRAAFNELSKQGLEGAARQIGMPLQTMRNLVERTHANIPRHLFRTIAFFFQRIERTRGGWTPKALDMRDPVAIEHEWRRLWQPKQ